MKVEFQKGGVLSALVAILLVFSSPSDGQSGPVPFAAGEPLWNSATPGASGLTLSGIADPHGLRAGQFILLDLPGGTQTAEIEHLDDGALGDTVMTGALVSDGSPFRLTIGGAGITGVIEHGGEIYRLRPLESGASQLLDSNSAVHRDLTQEENDVVAQALRLAASREPGVLSITAGVTPAFARHHGLATRLRAQDLVAAANAALTASGRAVVLDLVALRDAPAGTPSDPGIAFASVDSTQAEVIVAAVLPSSRAVQVGATATAFATIINAGAETASQCGLQLSGADPAGTFTFQTTDVSNAPVGTVNGLVDIAPGASQSFVFAFTPSATFEPGGDLPLEFVCTNRASANVTPGVNTLWFSASATPVPDIIAISEVGAGSGLNSQAGVVDIIDRQRNGAFVVATTNVGAGGTLVASAAPTDPSLPVTVRICQTNPVTGACLVPADDSVSLTIAPGETPTFAVFVIGIVPVSFSPASNRIQVVFRENGAVRGSTTVAVRTLLSEPVLPAVSFLYADADVALPAHFRNGPVAASDNTPPNNAITNPGATLGRVLFYDRRLSANNVVSCASCHTQATGFSEDAQFSAGFAGALTTRHSPGLSNGRYYDRGHFFWDERANTLEDQVLAPIQSEVEMGLTLDEAVSRVAAEAFYADLFTAAFGDPEVTTDRMSLAMAQFVRSMVSANSRFDQALAAGPLGSQAFANSLTAEEFLGVQLFMPVPNSDIQDVGCGACHNTLAHISDDVHNIGLENPPVDAGAGNGTFKAPSLRNVGVRAQFMHDGRFSSLAQVIEHYNSGVVASPDLDVRLRQGPNPQRLNLTDAEKAALEAFMHTLTDDSFLTDPRFSDPFVD